MKRIVTVAFVLPIVALSPWSIAQAVSVDEIVPHLATGGFSEAFHAKTVPDLYSEARAMRHARLRRLAPRNKKASVKATGPRFFVVNAGASPQVLEVYDLPNRTLIDSWSFPNFDYYFDVAYDSADDAIWISDMSDEYLIQFDPADGTMLNYFYTAANLRGVAYDPKTDTLWTGHAQDGPFVNWSKTGDVVGLVYNNGVSSWTLGMVFDPTDDTLLIHDDGTQKVLRIDVSGTDASVISSCSPSYGSDNNPTGLTYNPQTGVYHGWGYTTPGPIAMAPACNDVGSWNWAAGTSRTGGDLEKTAPPVPAAGVCGVVIIFLILSAVLVRDCRFPRSAVP